LLAVFVISIELSTFRSFSVISLWGLRVSEWLLFNANSAIFQLYHS
jgi:hypothetical protein